MSNPRVRVVVDRSALNAFLRTQGLRVADQAANRILDRARTTAPVKTGAYRAGLTVQRSTTPDGLPAVNVGSTARHARFVEADTGNLVRATQAAKG